MIEFKKLVFKFVTKVENFVNSEFGRLILLINWFGSL